MTGQVHIYLPGSLGAAGWGPEPVHALSVLSPHSGLCVCLSVMLVLLIRSLSASRETVTAEARSSSGSSSGQGEEQV